MPPPQTIVDLLEREWGVGAAVPEGTEPENRGLDKGHVRVCRPGCAQQGHRPPHPAPWLRSSHGATLPSLGSFPQTTLRAAPQECSPAPMGCGKVGRGALSARLGARGLRRARGLDVLMGC